MIRPICFLLLVSTTAGAQFTPALLQNRSYWGDGKSEVDFYDLELVRDGNRYRTELTAVVTPLFLDSSSLVQLNDAKQPGALPAIRMQETVAAPRGIVSDQRSIEVLWRMDTMSLARLSVVGSDGFGNFSKKVEQDRTGQSGIWRYSADNYGGVPADSPITSSTAPPLMFYDELPLRLRTIDFAKAQGEFDLQLVPSIAAPATGPISPASATVRWKAGERTIEIDVQHSGGKEHVLLDANFPFLLREWQRADGSRLKMKNSLKLNLRDYLKPGDRDRALRDPMLRHPD